MSQKKTYRKLTREESAAGRERGRALLDALCKLAGLPGVESQRDLPDEFAAINTMVGEHINYFFEVGHRIGFEAGREQGRQELAR
jgi:hypothetical protein